MIPYEIDPSLHAAPPAPARLDDGFAPPAPGAGEESDALTRAQARAPLPPDGQR